MTKYSRPVGSDKEDVFDNSHLEERRAVVGCNNETLLGFSQRFADKHADFRSKILVYL
jgi:hypothetical protein